MDNKDSNRIFATILIAVVITIIGFIISSFFVSSGDVKQFNKTVIEDDTEQIDSNLEESPEFGDGADFKSGTLLGENYSDNTLGAEIDADYFTNEEMYNKYIGTNGYLEYNNEEIGISFLYPKDWEISINNEREIKITKSLVNEYIGNINLFCGDGSEVSMTVDKFNSYGVDWEFSVNHIDGYHIGNFYQGKGLVNNKDTIYYYRDAYNDAGAKIYFIEYYTLLENEDMQYFSISSDSEDIFNCVVGTLLW